ncbi:MAG: DEAD/DEAH box helicase [Chloroflexi bacterium]|nr:DEAD/DEAH box helicase [Chloroflexota bacterium]
MNLVQVVEQLLQTDGGNITAHRHLPAKAAKLVPFPASTDPRLVAALRERGIAALYSHQATAATALAKGRHVVVVTPTASGKTLCYNLPVLNTLLSDPQARALYLFPTKALSQDQIDELRGLVDAMDVELKTHTYDGDTPVTARPLIRKAGHIVVTNPDMLHTGILPHHVKWMRLFENLRYVVVDELHQYRGVFGSHVANVLRRLRRICSHYGSEPQFIFCSATIANPKELAEKLLGEEVELVDDNGAPRGEKHVILYNPPLVNRQLGLRRGALLTARGLAANFLANRIQTIVFARSRLTVEVMLTYLQEAARQQRLPAGAVRGYRGGYLPLERREIERGLREGGVLGVVSTNALELGVDIGGLEAAVLVGYPGTVASTWQQMGRAGRRRGASAAVFVASSNPLDQYLVNHPDYFFSSPPEHGLVNPDNLLVLMDHLKCAAFELPFGEGERFGVETTAEALDYLVDSRVLYRSKGAYHWSSDSFPAEQISLRSAARENFVIIDQSQGARVIGEVDRYAAPTMIHEEAIYIHEGRQYQVVQLDYEEKKAFVEPVNVDYYTDANLAVELQVLAEDAGRQDRQSADAHGDVRVTYVPTIFKKIKFDTHENLGSGPIYLPQEEMHTTAYWLTLGEDTLAGFDREQIQSGLNGLGNLLVNVAPLFLMCDPGDIRVACQIRSPHTGRPTAFLYEFCPGGVGMSERLFRLRDDLLQRCLELVRDCPCEDGCPSCVGPAGEVGESGKAAAARILSRLLSDGPR